MRANCEADIRDLPGGTVIVLSGDIDTAAADVLTAAYEGAAGTSPAAVVLDFSEVGYINSTGIALIISVLARARAEGRTVAAAGLSAHYREIFDITRLSDFIGIYPDSEHALKGPERPGGVTAARSRPGRTDDDCMEDHCITEEHMDGTAVRMDVRHAGGRVAVIDIEGDVTAACEPVLASAYEEAASRGAARVVLNFTGLEYMNSGGIGMLVTLLVRANRQHQQLAACGLSGHYREIFELTRLDEAITIYDDEPSALAGVTPLRRP